MIQDANPLLEPFSAPHGAFPFDRIRKEHFRPAIEALIEVARAHVAALRDRPEPATFENTIAALEAADERLELSSAAFFNLLGTDGDEEMHRLAQEISPLLAAFANDVSLDEALFRRVKAVFDDPASRRLDPERAEVLERIYKGFVRNGALLGAADKARLRAIDEELSRLSPKFDENVLKDTNRFELWVEDPAQVAGIPAPALAEAAAKAKAKGREGAWLFTLHAPSYVPFVTYGPDRALRETIWRAFARRGYGGDHDNTSILLRIARLRKERARLLGFGSHADYVLAERMAGSLGRVRRFYDDMLAVVLAAARRDIADVRELKTRETGDTSLFPWDVAYWSERLKKQRFDFDSEQLRPYFVLDRVLDGMFEHARRLFGVTFRPVDGIPLYHPEVRVFEARDEADGRFLGLLFTDFFPRDTKRSGAWMSPMKSQGLWGGQVCRPLIAIVCNFTRPTGDIPSLLSYDEVLTLFHEFGHALHGLLSDVRHRSVACTNVYWDFVELPSQIMENWIKEKPSLDLIGRHYQTGEAIPDDLIARIKTSATFQAGLMGLRQIQLGLIDLAWHAGDPDAVEDVERFEDEQLAPVRVIDRVPGSATSHAFQHIFSGGYSAGYYSYKWAEVLEADAFACFLEEGLFNPATGRRFRESILSRGGSEKPMELFKRFRGREPDPKALLRRDGLLEEAGKND
jgi:peptidyl-dipeptidase Dcp